MTKPSVTSSFIEDYTYHVLHNPEAFEVTATFLGYSVTAKPVGYTTEDRPVFYYDYPSLRTGDWSSLTTQFDADNPEASMVNARLELQDVLEEHVAQRYKTSLYDIEEIEDRLKEAGSNPTTLLSILA